MRGLTLTPPWATLIAVAATHPKLGKHIETRGWRFPDGLLIEPLAIHQAQGLPRGMSEADMWQIALSEPFRSALAAVGIMNPARLPRGQIVAVVVPRDCVPTHNPAFDNPPGAPWFTLHRGAHIWHVPPPVSEPEWFFGDYAPGRWATLLDAIRALPTPIACRGRQGLWPVPLGVQEAIKAQIGGDQ